MHLLIFSKDRACQLYLLLESISRFGKFSTIDVLYKTSNDEYNTAYKVVEKKYPHIAFIRESDFRRETLRLIELSGDDVCLSTDDQVFYREFGTPPPLAEHEVFSYRLGLNTIVQNPHTGELQPPLNNYCKDGNIISWNPQYYHPLYNYGYPFAIDVHCFNNKLLYDLLNSFSWSNTNQIESGLFRYRNLISVIYSYNKSVSFNIPVNNMSGVTISGKYHPYSNKELNDLFLSGKKINLDNICKNSIKGCHQEVKYEFIQRD